MDGIGIGIGKDGTGMDVRVGLLRKLSTEELLLLNCSVGGDS